MAKPVRATRCTTSIIANRKSKIEDEIWPASRSLWSALRKVKTPPAFTLLRRGGSVRFFAALQSEGWARQDSNLGPRDYESPALTAELQARIIMEVNTANRSCPSPKTFRGCSSRDEKRFIWPA